MEQKEFIDCEGTRIFPGDYVQLTQDITKHSNMRLGNVYKFKFSRITEEGNLVGYLQSKRGTTWYKVSILPEEIKKVQWDTRLKKVVN